MAGLPDPNAPPAAPQKGFWGQLADTVMPNPPTWEGTKQLAKGMVTPPDPYKAAGDMIQNYQKGDYAGALEAGMGMPGIPQQGMFVKPYDRERFRGAMELVSNGASQREIWGKTQTGIIPGNHWVQEIPDHMADVKPSSLPPRKSVYDHYSEIHRSMPEMDKNDIMTAAKAAYRMTVPQAVDMQDFLYHPKLFEVEPELARMPVVRNVDFTRVGGYNPNIEQFSVSPPAKNHDIVGTTLHEIQHYIQDRNKWPEGGNPQMFAFEPYKSMLRPNETGMQAYHRLAGEQLSNAVERRAMAGWRRNERVHPMDDMSLPYDEQLIVRTRR